MVVSLFLAKLLGIYFLIVGIALFIRKNEMSRVIQDIFRNPGFIFFAGALSLIFGLVIVLIHPIWELNWRGLITLLGLLEILKGIARLFIPEKARDLAIKLIQSSYGFQIASGITVLIGAFLTYQGFTG